MITARNAAGIYSWQQVAKRKTNIEKKNINPAPFFGIFDSSRRTRSGCLNLYKNNSFSEKRCGIKGFVNSTVLVVTLLFVCGAIYLYSINSSAVKGYQVRQVEKEILELKKQNEDLKIREAELKSLYHVEESSKNMNMGDLKNISYIEETGPVAMK